VVEKNFPGRKVNTFMKTTRFEVLSQNEVERIHAASMEILAEVGIKVNFKKARG
jgi:trimethylamine:corrinoid methyltransferase-like protein